MNTRRIEIISATSDGDVAAVQLLFRDYAAFLKVDLCFQDFEEEMATFPKFYKLLLLARVDGLAAAAVGLKDIGDGVCEMKRLYARPNFQGLGLGRRLCGDLIDAARSLGFRLMRLDTLKRLKPALSLYKKFGFVEIEKYYDNPEDGVVYMELDLRVENEDTIDS
ncbi:hypothetical protein MNBD_ALPHA05-2067 [hydrothermal vent metagenome]|uniref:N-acetyltransferase domain-containing protein n=1 Tax=hydrothermal vent metagenome TaxID=652676 RepID=A0A3B0RJ59_9ZZZZ